MIIDTAILSNSKHSFVVDEIHNRQRVDKVLSEVFTSYTRSFLKKLFENGNVTIKGKAVKPSLIVKQGEIIDIYFPDAEKRSAVEIPQYMNITIVAKENDFLIINKPATILTHAPNHTCEEATVSDWVIKHEDSIAHVGTVDRPGIVHRLDRDTSGLMIIPRTNEAHQIFSDMFKDRAIQKTYLALVQGHPKNIEGSIDFWIDRHPSLRHKMHAFNHLTKKKTSKESLTHYKVLKDYETFSLVEVKPKTGRTHQIRVHFTAIGHPLLGDSLYGSKSKLMPYHALHAHKLEFTYKGKAYNFEQPLPPKMKKVIDEENKG